MKFFRFASIAIFSVLLMQAFLLSCKKNDFIEGRNAYATTSVDSLHFDTLFTGTNGSTSQLFKIYNQNDRKLMIDEVSLSGGLNSPYKININGQPGPLRTNIEVEPNDSLYVFVSVKIETSAAPLPFAIRDSIKVSSNGNLRWVQLEAWGLNAHVLKAHRITTNTTWTNGKPYLLYDGLVVDKGVTLTITEGTRIYSHANSPIEVNGTLKVLGGAADSNRVIFQSDRLDDPYRGFPGSWPGIVFGEESIYNEIHFAEIRNAYQGLALTGRALSGDYKVSISESLIDNCFDAGIISYASSVDAVNLIVSNCGKGINLLFGGDFRFRHCTISAVSTNYMLHKEPAVSINDYTHSNASVYTNTTFAIFENCIFWGSYGTVENEIAIDRQGDKTFEVKFDQGLWKMKDIPPHIEYTGMILNEDPLFELADTENHLFNYQLAEGSPAIDKGKPSDVTIDFDNKLRDALLPDLGAYEK